MKNILCVIDIQREYNTPGRPYYISGIGESLQNASLVLDHARINGWEVLHVQHFNEGNVFSKEESFSDFIDGFEPKSGEKICIKDDFSSFSSSEFCRALENRTDAEIYVIGYGSTMCCLSTIVDGYHRGYNFTFISDASNAKPTQNLDSKTLHKSATEILQTFSKIKFTKDLLSNV